jgi:PTH1 family peptidyl-tRNA hydrolase
LPFGTIRLRARGSAGGHNGLKSIIAALGTSEFMRLRIGIQPDHPVSEAKKFVLDEFAPAERRALKEILDRSADAVRTVLREGIVKAMSLYKQGIENA